MSQLNIRLTQLLSFTFALHSFSAQSDMTIHLTSPIYNDCFPSAVYITELSDMTIYSTPPIYHGCFPSAEYFSTVHKTVQPTPFNNPGNPIAFL